ncbi:F-box protein At5g07610-like [Aristolochia californica]|uniref:F-box protein At5g07610-like n=1 Tax=Aristolochia californica TaxID=171875 RepID=UPI0035DE6091
MDALKKSNTSVRSGCSLSDDLLIEILRRLPFKSLARFKCVSKAWHSLISDPCFQTRLPSPMIGLFYQKWGINEGEIGYAVVSNESFGTQFITDLSLTFCPAYRKLWFMDCRNGLLLFLHGSARLPGRRAYHGSLPSQSDLFYVCNPITRRWTPLPHCPATNPLVDSVLVFDPRSSPHFKVIRICFFNKICLELTIFDSKTGFWIKFNLTTAPPRCRLTGRGVVSSDGVVYRLAYPQRLLRINIVDENVTEIELPEKWSCLPSFGLYNGNIHCALFREGYQLRIWELKDSEASEWVLKHTNCLETELKQKFGWFGRLRLLAFHLDLEVIYMGIFSRIISYNFNNETLEDFCSLSEQHHLMGNLEAHPFVPCFLDSLLEAQNNQ